MKIGKLPKKHFRTNLIFPDPNYKEWHVDNFLPIKSFSTKGRSYHYFFNPYHSEMKNDNKNKLVQFDAQL